MNVSLERIHTFGMSSLHKARGDEPTPSSRNIKSPNEGGKRIMKTESMRTIPTNMPDQRPGGDAALSDKKEDLTSSDDDKTPDLEVKV